MAILDGAATSYDEIVRQVLAMPFLSKSRLVIVNNLFGAKKDVLEKIIEFLPKVPSTTVLVIVQEGNPDRRTSLYKKLNKPKVSEEFKLLEPDQLRRWVIGEIENRKSKIEAGAVSKLIEYVGSDLWRMSNEIDKLIAYRKSEILNPKSETNSKSQIINTEDIELLVQPQIQSNIFNLMDSMANKNIQGAMKELYKLYGEGKAEAYILSMIVLQYRNLLIIKDLSDRAGGRINPYAVAKQAGLHPFVAGKNLAIVGKYEFSDLKKIYRNLLEFDAAIKTGKMESRVALELLVYKLTATTNYKK